MKLKGLGIPLFVVASTFLPWPASAAGWYGSFELGQANFSPDPFSVLSGPGTTKDMTHSSYRLVGGYQFDQHFGIEAGYVDLGRANLTQSSVIDDVNTGTLYPGAYHSTVKAHGFPVEAIGIWPLTGNWDAYGRGGAFFGHTDDDNGLTVPGHPGLGSNRQDSESSTGLTFGFGVDWNAAPRLKIRLSWDRYAGLDYNNGLLVIGGRGGTGHYQVNVLAIGVVYSFD